MVSCKSPVKVMRAAHALGSQLFDERAHKFARKDYTLPQLFACLVLREHRNEKGSSLICRLPRPPGVAEGAA